MAFKDLLLHLDATKTCAKRVEAALAFAAAREARLDAIFCLSDHGMGSYALAEVPPSIIAEQQRRQRAEGERVLAEFRQAAQRAGVEAATRFVDLETFEVGREIALQARHYDMVILGQETPDEGDNTLAADVVLGCGRPVLVVPYIGLPHHNGQVKLPGRRVLVAWNAGREATRAVHDALPILKAAEQVVVLSVNPRRRGSESGEEPGADIGAHLARHGVTVEVDQLDGRDLDAADAVLARLSDEGADLLVIGAYGHTRLREMILGGVTEAVFDHMTVPVLMSH